MSYLTQFMTGGGGGSSIMTINPDSGIPVVPLAGEVSIVGGGVLTTAGTPNTLTVNLVNGTDGQVLIGGGAAPAWADIVSTDGSVSISTGANSLDLEVSGSFATIFRGDGATDATPALGVLTVAGGVNISTLGAGSTMTISLDAAISLATSVTSPLYTVASGNVVINMTDDAGANAVSFTNDSDVEVASIDSLGVGSFVDVEVTSATQYTVAIYGSGGELNEVSGVGTSGQVLTSNGAAMDPSWQDTSMGFTWNEETGTSASMAVDNGYIANNAGLVTLTLPTTAAVGSVVRVVGKGAGGWLIAQNASESIVWDEASVTTVGVGGSLASTDDFDAVELLCTTADTTWVVLSSKGNITIV